MALAYAMCAAELRWPGWITPKRGRKRCLSATVFCQACRCTNWNLLAVSGQQDLQASLAQLDEGWLDSQDLCPTSKKIQSAARAFRKHSQSHGGM